jgi:hypothetical protein
MLQNFERSDRLSKSTGVHVDYKAPLLVHAICLCHCRCEVQKKRE